MVKGLLNKSSSIVFDGADGAYLYSGQKRYVDVCCGNGTHILGHRKISLLGGMLFGGESRFAEEYIELLRRHTGFNNFVLCNSGSEATMRLARIARAYTGKDKIVVFNGGHHGSSDTFLDCDGVPQAVKDLTVRLPYDESSCGIIENMEDIALVLCEPVQGALPINKKELLHKIQASCKKSGILFGLDEVITGFRLMFGGGKKLYDLDPDLVSYGKVAGGGLPIGVVAGKDEIMDDVKDRVFFGGTFSGNPATLYTGIHVLSEMSYIENYDKINWYGRTIRDEIKISGCQVVGVGSLNRVIFTDKPVTTRAERDAVEDNERKEKFLRELYNQGVYMRTNYLMFNSVVHDADDIGKIIEGFNNAGKKV